ncbi:hypothetical protein SYNPS1DRAFT_27194 [Syncephalis pseudoplumigaleata]|uniref:F-box domain-containing protein n=1 Tax=Syncephalis pseudoplumigaleata TaxID=1712513 RepID=A0A4V1J231_9FUNG|nr:hypothetical protein SYNPS1DRAFT_27194 [Syncephalis pseudoplumigaleata]|eukprot:RKP27139.1 hypothetical protein SYNPS1DRAFT_27194 [Syncephalis pseudoplumigaleata]
MAARQSPASHDDVTRTGHFLRRFPVFGGGGGNNASTRRTSPDTASIEVAHIARSPVQREHLSHAALHQLVTGSQAVALISRSTRAPAGRRTLRTSMDQNKQSSCRRSSPASSGRSEPILSCMGHLSHCFLRCGFGCTRKVVVQHGPDRQWTTRQPTKEQHNDDDVGGGGVAHRTHSMDVVVTLKIARRKAQLLPPEIVVAILSSLYRPKDIRAAQLTCRLWYTAAETALVHLRRRLPYAGMSILEALRTCINGMPRPSAHDVSFRRRVSQLGSDYIACNPDVVAAFHPIDPLDFIRPLIWTFLFIDREHHGLIASNNHHQPHHPRHSGDRTGATIHHVTTHTQSTQTSQLVSVTVIEAARQMLMRHLQALRLSSFFMRYAHPAGGYGAGVQALDCRYFVRLVRKEYPRGRRLDKRALQVGAITRSSTLPAA